jgi:hypothetical protein
MTILTLLRISPQRHSLSFMNVQANRSWSHGKLGLPTHPMVTLSYVRQIFQMLKFKDSSLELMPLL